MLSLLALIAIILLTGIIAQRYVDVSALRAFIAELGPLAPVTAIALVALRAMLFLPVLPIRGRSFPWDPSA